MGWVLLGNERDDTVGQKSHPSTSASLWVPGLCLDKMKRSLSFILSGSVGCCWLGLHQRNHARQDRVVRRREWGGHVDSPFFTGRNVRAQGSLEGENKPMWGGCGPEATFQEEGRVDRRDRGRERPIGLGTRKRVTCWQALEEEGG